MGLKWSTMISLLNKTSSDGACWSVLLKFYLLSWLSDTKLRGSDQASIARWTDCWWLGFHRLCPKYCCWTLSIHCSLCLRVAWMLVTVKYDTYDFWVLLNSTCRFFTCLRSFPYSMWLSSKQSSWLHNVGFPSFNIPLIFFLL